MTKEVMTIREMCEAFDVTPRTLRFYEAKELIFPIREGQKRLFTKRDRARLKLIMRGKKFGFSLEEIRQLLDLFSEKDAGAAQLRETLKSYRVKLAGMEEQKQLLLSVMADLEHEIEFAETELEKQIREAKSS
ncbi:MerR family DNA-binding transcriptional regulator [Celeribacter baekdonensis]|mgnify:CR=1 FL=1|jgi:DNA-binding transcriptional MerR regulator|uniref:MerR family transcriptional regulator n=1 Tax=Celeribacter baekdonensis TaxID=875171 RepID=A0A2R4M477_9RHOB|nr:MerR family DNA-binding transcriptional regulator [Celeribacter baekdonensis]AVW91852.1 MerR family transcriptional regulator [Celeribacter baekdonensis]|tara:strand:+ start:53547 stop:53945 length:399 start_codon:yes stop_codon:yes gene_type:complete